MARQTGESNRATRIAQDGGADVDGKKTATETGTFLGEFPYVRFGSGPEKLVTLPGITLDNEPPNRFAAWTHRLGFGRFARDYAVYVINRRRGMPPGYTTQDMALNHPGVLRSLVLVVSACRLSEEGRKTCQRWQALAREGRWQELRADMASVTVSGEKSKRFARAFMMVFGGLVFRVPSDSSDFLTTLDADLSHDTAGRLGEISTPTLVIGGTEDPFFSESLLRETAEKIPDATLRVYDGVGHGVPKERKRRYEEDTLAFIDDRHGGSSGQRNRTTSPRTKETR